MKVRTKSAEELANETEFYRRRNMVGCNVRYMSDPRAFTVVLSVNAFEVGIKTEFKSRAGKVSTVLYSLPSLAPLEALLALPVKS